MTKYALDTQMLIRAGRNDTEAERMFHSLSASVLYLNSVVAHELLSGAHQGELRGLKRELLRPFEKLGRVVTPTHQAWKDAGRILYTLRSAGWQITSSFINEVLIAVSAAQIGGNAGARQRARLQRNPALLSAAAAPRRLAGAGGGVNRQNWIRTAGSRHDHGA